MTLNFTHTHFYIKVTKKLVSPLYPTDPNNFLSFTEQ